MRRNRKIIVKVLSLLFISSLLLPTASANPSWWADGQDAASDARAVWVYFSNEYSALFNTEEKTVAEVQEMKDKNIDIIIASLTAADMDGLLNQSAERTKRLQQLINAAAFYGITVYAGYWEDRFNGSEDQMGKYTKVDSVLAFNEQNGSGNADFVGVVTDYEMHGTDRTKERFEQWRQFHLNLRDRIGSSPLKLLPTISEPDDMIAKCTNCDSSWKQSNGITGTNPYTGDVKFFSSFNGETYADGLIGMYYYGSPATILARAEDDIGEANAMSLPVPIIVGISAGTNSIDPTLLTHRDINDAVARVEAKRVQFPDGVLGTMFWKWDQPGDSDDEYKGVMSNNYDVTEDAFVRSGSFAGTNYGSSSVVEVKDAPSGTAGADYDRIGYLKFNFDAYSGSSVSTATLYFYVKNDVTDPQVSNVPVTVQGLVDDNWSEKTVTWDSRPGSTGGSVLGSVSVASAGWYSIDVTDYINNGMTDRTVTFRISDDATLDRLVSIEAKNGAANGAYLKLTP
ncbi:CBM96 family carbohydrate-binding protein [Paenibacillus nasutitermitis]|uniref:Carbohydrate-binding module family 96 domain-containing protein n=1 Tax=Paenibacillus nasutitermitis TaxID=1652958 RepID=A0A916ZAD0_9BACL|nr:DNRLRE domain-containing protein [Paenibacillus nasutitermitis]GGD83713.1 hypothetical protein GCM10010911_47370 [Paenibacillus nasutitermitis]